jgi:C4-dicarboxylate-specific signal transduction histidine kinase
MVFYIEKERHEFKNTVRNQQTQLISNLKLISLGEMSGGIAHEINNPLMVIDGANFKLKKLSEEGKLTPEILSKITERLDSSISRMHDLVMSMRYVSQGDITNRDEKKEVSVDSLLNYVHKTLFKDFEDNKIPFVITNNIKDVVFLGHETLLGIVLNNLLANALDAVKGRPEPKVELILFQTDESVIFRVVDNGEGITEEVQQTMFLMFNTTKEVGKGQGMGLAICKGIVDAHDGTISFETGDSGSAFEVRLPKN